MYWMKCKGKFNTYEYIGHSINFALHVLNQSRIFLIKSLYIKSRDMERRFKKLQDK